jgi:beta-lactamase regulating signal transducer with metallopeptidase domain
MTTIPIVTGLASTVLIKGSVVLLVALVLARRLRRTSARASLVIAIGFATLVLLPVLSVLTPDWGLGDLTISHDAATNLPGLPFSPLALLLSIWALGASVMLGRLILDVRAAHALSSRATVVLDSRMTDCLRCAARSIGSPIPVVRMSGELHTVALVGFRRPVLLVPGGASDWSEEELVGVFCHELEHLRRGDWLWSLVERAIAAVYWINPLTHVALRWSRAAREHAADDAAMRGGVGAHSYANRLIMVARASRRSPQLAGSVAFAGGRVDGRVRALFEMERDRRGVSAMAAARMIVLAMPLVLALSALQPWTCVPAGEQPTTTRCP